MALGRPNVASDVAACYDCHGHHDVFPVSDPRSRLSKERILGTCQQCHEGVTPKFTEYQPHADPLDAANYPLLNKVFLFMTALLIGVFGFFGLHTLLWLVRSVYLYLNDTKTFREAKVQVHSDDEQFTRFTPFERALHLMVVTSFLLLVLTGMPLKFYYTELGEDDLQPARRRGGRARSLHHFGAIITFAYFVLHLGELVRTLWSQARRRAQPATGRSSCAGWAAVFGPDSMVPSFQDWRDFIAHQKWFFGKGPRPQFDRWTYWERFDYFAVFWGIFAIGVSGLVMWFPKFFTASCRAGSSTSRWWSTPTRRCSPPASSSPSISSTRISGSRSSRWTRSSSPGASRRRSCCTSGRRWYDRLVATGRLEAATA
jgi:cytochrome b subunit of formate dehydrogenase